jgi:hypothetical protein
MADPSRTRVLTDEQVPDIGDGKDRVKPPNWQCDKLTLENVKNWKSRIRELLELQQCWEVIEQTKRLAQEDAELLTYAMRKPIWRTNDSLAKALIGTYISNDNYAALRDVPTSGERWNKLIAKYEPVNKKRRTALMKRLFAWKIEPSTPVVSALEEFERIYQEVRDITDSGVNLNEEARITLFLSGLPREYEARVEALEAVSETNRDVILLRLQEREIDLNASRPGAEAGSGGQISEAANRAFQGNCFTCGKPGHKAYECEKGHGPAGQAREQNRGNGGNRGRGGSARGGQNYRGNRRNAKPRENARTADRENDGEIDEPPYFNKEGDNDENYSEIASRAIEIQLDKRISEQNEHLLGEEEEERAYRASPPGPVIDSGATASYSPAKHLFVKLDTRYKGRLGTAGKGIPIQGKGDMLIPLPDSPPAKICGVLYCPAMRETLLSTQTLYKHGIYNTHGPTGYRFFRANRRIIATGTNIGRTSYLN